MRRHPGLTVRVAQWPAYVALGGWLAGIAILIAWSASGLPA